MTEPQVGRRERKKAQTRKALSDSALRLFAERGYDRVSLKDVADAADVAVSTVFKHFPAGKEALVFDEDIDLETALVAAVRERGTGQSILDALRDYLIARAVERAAQPDFADFVALVESTPALSDYARRMWGRHEAALAAAIADETGLTADDIAARALAHYALEAIFLIRGDGPSIETQLSTVFDLLRRGWGNLGK
jgi:AcrR family transcriptional regulator